MGTVIDDIEVVDLEARYRVEGTLGQGGMGAVLLATDTRLDRKVAIKRILGEAAGNRMAVQRFLTEAKAIAALNHPNIVQIYEFGRAKDGPFLIMEYVDGGSLLDRCRESALPLEDAIDLACQLCDGLAKAHDLKIIHRDIKPANVLLTREGIPKLTDFGLAKAEAGDHGQTMTGAVLGTPDFMPPEQRRDASLVDHRSDLWSLAATVYQMATGRSPKIIRFDLLPAELTKVLGKALEDAKDDRYQSARELRDALKTGLRTAAAVEELIEGACPACGVKNESSRRFCRGCGESLEAECLSCTKAMPMWEDFCGSCGAKQAPLVAERREAMAARQAEAEGLLGDFEFERAAQIAVELRDEPHRRLRYLTGWAETFLEQVDKSRAEQTRHAVETVEEAAKHEAVHDYLSAVFALESIPQPLRVGTLPNASEPAATALKRVKSRQQETSTLESKVKSKLASKDLDDLLPIVERLLELQPDRQDVRKLRTQLRDRNEKLNAAGAAAFREAHALLATHDYEGVVAVLTPLKGMARTIEVDTLQEQAAGLLARTRDLNQRIRAAVATKRFEGLLDTVEKYLKLKPAAEEIHQLRQSLVEREKKVLGEVAKWLEKAKRLELACRFDEAAKILEGIPESRRSGEAIAAMTRLSRLASLRKVALGELNTTDGSFGNWVDASQSYRTALAETQIADAEFESLFGKVSSAWNEVTLTRRYIYLTGMAVIGLMVMVTIVGVGLWIRSTVRAASLANAIAQSRWDDALLLDPHNVTCLIGRARGKLTVSPPDIDGAFADLDRAERQPGVASLVQPARAEAHATRAAAEARAGRLERAAQDLQAAKRGGAEQAILASAQAVIAESWLARGRQSAAKGDGAAIRSEVDEALAAGADRGAVIALWRDYVNGRIAKLDAKGVELACTESKKAGLTGVDEAKWWIRFGAIAAAPPHENAAEVIRAVDKAAAAGAQESVTAPLQASVLVLEAIALQSTGDAKGAVSKILSALLLDAGLAEQALNQPKAASLRTSVLAEYRSRFDTAVADANWPEALRVAATAGTIAKTSASWVGETFGAMPHAALASLPRPALAGLTTLAETFEKPTSGLYSRTGDPRVNGVQREEAMSFFRMTSGHDEVIAKGEPYAVYFPVLLSPTERETVEVSFRCRRFVRSPEGKDSFLAVEFVDSKTDVNAALTGPKLGQQITIYNNRMFSRQRNGHAVIGLHSIDGRSGADGHVPCMNEQEWMKVSLWLQLSKSSKNQNQNIFLWTFVNGLRLSTGVLFGDKGERLPERLGVCFIAYGSRAINSFGQREPVLGEAKGSIYDIADVTCRLIATPTRAAKTMEECQFP